MKRIDLTDVTFLLPVRVDSNERLVNVNIVIDFLSRNFEAPIFVIEADVEEKLIVPSGIKKIFINDEKPYFHRTRFLNILTRLVVTPFIAIWDVDVVCDTENIIKSVEKLRNGIADMVYPYSLFIKVNPQLKEDYIFCDCNLAVLEENKSFLPLMSGRWAVGGAFLVNREAYVFSGMENEKIYGWGPEDVERYVRWKNLGYRIERDNGDLFHLPHPVGLTSTHASKKIENHNRKEYLKICSMHLCELKDYVKEIS